MAAAAVATAFLGAFAATPGGIGWPGGLGLALFAGVEAICIWILAPRRAWKGGIDPGTKDGHW